MTSPAAGQVSAADIAGLLAWTRSLSDAGPSADPAERAAYQAAKTTLLARITGRPSASSSQRTLCD
jgi:hypothetical protein